MSEHEWPTAPVITAKWHGYGRNVKPVTAGWMKHKDGQYSSGATTVHRWHGYFSEVIEYFPIDYRKAEVQALQAKLAKRNQERKEARRNITERNQELKEARRNIAELEARIATLENRDPAVYALPPEPDWLDAPAVLAACYVCGIEAHEERGWLKGYEEGLAKREQEVSKLQEVLEARNEKIRELTSRKKSPKTAREALELAWELAYPVREGQVWPDGARGISKVNGELLTLTAHCAYSADESDVLAVRSLEPLPDPESEPDWTKAPAVIAVCNDRMDRAVFVRNGDNWWVSKNYAGATRDLRDVTPLYPKEDA